MHKHSSPGGRAGREEVSLSPGLWGGDTVAQRSARQGGRGAGMLHQRRAKAPAITSPRNSQVTGHGLRADLCP